MQRKDIKNEDKWDLGAFFKSINEYDELYNEIKKDVNKLISYKGNITKDSKTLFDFLELEYKISLGLEKIYVYSYLEFYSDTTNEDNKILKDKADKLDEYITEQTSFITSELLSTPYEKILAYIEENNNLEKYRFNLEKTFRYQSHTLSEQEERIISLATVAFGTGDNVFSALDNADVKFENVIIDGKEIELNHSNYIKFMGSKNQKERKEVFEKYYKYFENHKNSIAEMYKGQIKEDTFLSKVRKYNSPLEESLYADAISVDVYKNLINTIRNNIKPLYEYMDLRKKVLGLDELHMYDIYVDLIKGVPKTFEFDEAKNILFNALNVLGDKYISDLSQAFTDGWIDKYPNDGKRSGAYQWGSYGIQPYVAMNFEGTEDCVSTLAHELGHAMHTYYSDLNNNYHNAGYPIFLAEIASTVNEILVNEYMLKNAKNNEEKLLYITSFLDKFRTSVYRQTMFAEFEMIIHDKEQNGEPITTESLADTYYELNKYYHGDNVISDEQIKYEWSRIPHFYTPFYVYKYATGFCSAIAIASDILSGKENAKENYLQFLSSGGSDYPLNILKKCNVDMTTEEPILKAIKMFQDKLEEAKKIYEEVENGRS